MEIKVVAMDTVIISKNVANIFYRVKVLTASNITKTFRLMAAFCEIFCKYMTD